MKSEAMNLFVADVMSGRHNRRDLFRRAAALGISATVAGVPTSGPRRRGGDRARGSLGGRRPAGRDTSRRVVLAPLRRKWDDLERRLDEALEIAGDDHGIANGIVIGCPVAWAVMAKGVVRRDRGELDEATELFETALRIATEQGDPETAGWTRGNQIFLHCYRGEIDEALALAQRNYEAIERLGDVFSRTWALADLGVARAYQEDLEGALEAVEAAESLYREAMGSGGEAEGWRLLARRGPDRPGAHRRGGGHGRARRAASGGRGMAWAEVRAQRTLGRALAAAGKPGADGGVRPRDRGRAGDRVQGGAGPDRGGPRRGGGRLELAEPTEAGHELLPLVVEPRPAAKRVAPAAADQPVAASATEQRVRAALTEQEVGGSPTDKAIASRATAGNVSPSLALGAVPAPEGNEDVTFACAEQQVRGRRPVPGPGEAVAEQRRPPKPPTALSLRAAT